MLSHRSCDVTRLVTLLMVAGRPHDTQAAGLFFEPLTDRGIDSSGAVAVSARLADLCWARSAESDCGRGGSGGAVRGSSGERERNGPASVRGSNADVSGELVLRHTKELGLGRLWGTWTGECRGKVPSPVCGRGTASGTSRVRACHPAPSKQRQVGKPAPRETSSSSALRAPSLPVEEKEQNSASRRHPSIPTALPTPSCWPQRIS